MFQEGLGDSWWHVTMMLLMVWLVMHQWMYQPNWWPKDLVYRHKSVGVVAMAMGVEADVPMSPSCDGCPCAPPKLDLVLRRLRWLGAPKVPWIRYIFWSSHVWSQIYNIFEVCTSSTKHYLVHVCCLGIPGHHSLDWSPELGGYQQEWARNYRVLRRWKKTSETWKSDGPICSGSGSDLWQKG